MRTRGRFIVSVMVVALWLVPVAVVAGDRFVDVPSSNVFHGDISWLADTGITRGCNPPINDRFCPSDPVTREQMAAFLHRLAAAGVVDAASAAVATFANSAGSADTLDGLDSTAFLQDDRIVLSQGRGWTHLFGGAGAVQVFSNLERLTGSDLYYLGLATPNAIGGQGFYLSQVEICYNAVAEGDRIDSTTVSRMTNDNNASFVVADPTDRNRLFPASECYSIAVNDSFAPVGSAYSLQLSVIGAIRIIRTTSTYLPSSGGNPAGGTPAPGPDANADPGVGG